MVNEKVKNGLSSSCPIPLSVKLDGYRRIIAELLRNLLEIHIVFRNTAYPHKLATGYVRQRKRGYGSEYQP